MVTTNHATGLEKTITYRRFKSYVNCDAFAMILCEIEDDLSLMCDNFFCLFSSWYITPYIHVRVFVRETAII